MSRTLSLNASIGALALGAVLIAGALVPSAARAGEMLMYNFGGDGLHLYEADDQPVSYTETDSNGMGHTINVIAGFGPVSPANTASVTQIPLTGLGVCSYGNALACGFLEGPLALQVDSVSDNEYLRIQLPESTEIVKSVIVGLVTQIGSPTDSIAIFGSNIAFPNNAQVDQLLNNAIMNVGTDLGLGFWNIQLGYTGYEYLFFATGQPQGNGNDGYSLAQLAIQVPEPGTLTIFGLGLAGLGFARRRKQAA